MHNSIVLIFRQKNFVPLIRLSRMPEVFLILFVNIHVINNEKSFKAIFQIIQVVNTLKIKIANLTDAHN